MIGLDTNVLVRYLTRDDAHQAQAATHFIESELGAHCKGHVCLVTLAELAWVLRSRYGVERKALADVLEHVLADDRFVVQDASAAWAALDLYRDTRVDFSDALIAAVDRKHGCTKTVTFDRGAALIDAMQLLGA